MAYWFQVRFVTAVAILVACAAAAVSGSPASAAAAPPSLHLVRTNPLIVRGRAFRDLERVRVSLVSESIRIRRTVTASRSGTFTLSFGTVTFGPCIGFRIRAAGSGGSVAILKRLPLPGCMPE